MTVAAPPFVVDYRVGDATFSFLLLGPTSWADAEAHLAAIRATAQIAGSDVVEIDAAPAMDLWAEIADRLLAALTARGQAPEMALAGSVVLGASCIAAGLDRGAAAVCVAATLDQVYAMETGK